MNFPPWNWATGNWKSHVDLKKNKNPNPKLMPAFILKGNWAVLKVELGDYLYSQISNENFNTCGVSCISLYSIGIASDTCIITLFETGGL